MFELNRYRAVGTTRTATWTYCKTEALHAHNFPARAHPSTPSCQAGRGELTPAPCRPPPLFRQPSLDRA